MTLWTEANIKTLKKLFKQGYSASQIEKKIAGSTRSAVLGKLHRLGLVRHRTINRPPKEIANRIDGRTLNHGRNTPIRLKKKPDLRIVLSAGTAAPSLDIPLMNLEPRMCRWPTSVDRPHLFCGRPWTGEFGPYCAAHKARAVAADQPKKKQKPGGRFNELKLLDHPADEAA